MTPRRRNTRRVFGRSEDTDANRRRLSSASALGVEVAARDAGPELVSASSGLAMSQR
jgi:hypothetical protein